MIHLLKDRKILIISTQEL